MIVTVVTLQEYISKLKLSIPKDVALGIFYSLTGQEPRLVQFGDFVGNVSSILKESYSQRAIFMCKVCSQNSSVLNVQQLKTLLLWFMKILLTSECAKTIFPQLSNFNVSAEGSQRMIAYLLSSMREDPSVEITASEAVPLDKLEKWMTSTPLAVQVLETIFAFIFFYLVLKKGTSMPSDLMTYFGIELDPESGKVIPSRLLFPLKVQHPIYPETFDSKLLEQSSLMLLNNYFPPTLRGRVYPLFSSSHHGESFSTFSKMLLGCNGPTLLLVKDKAGYIFGGFASAKWQIDPNFTGLQHNYIYYTQQGISSKNNRNFSLPLPSLFSSSSSSLFLTLSSSL